MIVINIILWNLNCHGVLSVYGMIEWLIEKLFLLMGILYDVELVLNVMRFDSHRKLNIGRDYANLHFMRDGILKKDCTLGNRNYSSRLFKLFLWFVSADRLCSLNQHLQTF